MHECKIFYVDGTFKTCPRPYKQLVTVHGLYIGKLLPLAAVLFNRKEQWHYDELFRVIQIKATRLRTPLTIFMHVRAGCAKSSHYEWQLFIARIEGLKDFYKKWWHFGFFQYNRFGSVSWRIQVSFNKDIYVKNHEIDNAVLII